jgi:GT2 family glycosyltransferase
MSKTAVIILNSNLPDYTDMLVESLLPYRKDEYDVMVFDNGSTPEGMSKYTTYRSETNGFFGGGFEAARQIVLSNTEYDSLLFMNNDLTVHGMSFVSSLRNVMFRSFMHPTCMEDPLTGLETILGIDVVSPCFFNIEPQGQCHWKTMLNWGSYTPRVVPFVDMQSPLMSRRLLEAMGETDPLLQYGWGIDFWMALTCERNGWKMAVCDNVSMLHHNSLTVKRGVAGIDIPTYCRLAEEGQWKFIRKMGLENDFHRIRSLSENYTSV